jgi:hypothetical protein
MSMTDIKYAIICYKYQLWFLLFLLIDSCLAEKQQIPILV